MSALRFPPQDTLIGLALCVFALLPSVHWAFADSLIWPWDQAWYGEVAADLWYLLGSSPLEWMRGMLRLLGQKPPLVSWIGQFLMPFGLMIGNVEAALLMLSVAANMGTLFLLWLYARHIAPKRSLIAVLAVAACGSMPLFVGMGHQFVTEPLQSFIIAASFVTAALADRVRLPRLAILLVLLVFGGFAVKTTSPAYNGLALLLIALVAFRRWRRGERLLVLNRGDVALGLAAAALAAVTTAWYVVNLEGMLQHVRNALSADIAIHYGSASALPTKAVFWLSALGGGVSLLPAAGLSILGLTAITALTCAPTELRARNLPGAAALLALLHSALVLVQFMFQIVEETRYISTLMPMMTIVLAYALARIQKTWLEHVLLVACCAQLTAVNLMAARRFDIPSSTAWLTPLTANSDQRSGAAEIIANSCSEAKAFQYVIVGTEEPQMNANSLAFEAAKARNMTGFRCYYTGLGYAAEDLQPVLQRLESLNPAVIIVPTEQRMPSNPNFLNQAVAPFAQHMKASNRYRPLAQPLDGYILYHRQD